MKKNSGPSSFGAEVIAHLPRLRSYARHLCGNRSEAEDLIQETVLRALVHADQFKPGTNLLGWLIVILRNSFLNEVRRRKPLVSIDAVPNYPTATINSPQEAHVYMRDVTSRMECLPKPQRQALLLVAVEGHSYQGAAAKTGCAVGTMKSRVSRARSELEHHVPQRKRRSAHQADFDHLNVA